MGIFDKAKDLLAEHNETVDSGIDQVAGVINDRTGGQHAEQISGAGERIKQGVDDFAGTPGEPGAPAAEPTTPGPEPVPPAQPS